MVSAEFLARVARIWWANFRRGADLACGAIVLCGLNFNFGFLAFWCFKFLADFGVRILGKCGIFGAWFNFGVAREFAPRI